MSNGKTQLIQRKAVKELVKEAEKLKSDFKSYLNDLEMFRNPEFWKAVEETHQSKGKKFSSVKELLKELDT